MHGTINHHTAQKHKQVWHSEIMAKKNPNNKYPQKTNWLKLAFRFVFLLVSFILGMQSPGVVSCDISVDGFHTDVSLLISYNEETFDIYRSLCLWGVYLSPLKCALNFIWCILHMLHRGTEFPNCNKVST